MGYTELDRVLLSAWHRAQERLTQDPDALAAVFRRRQMSAYARPLRSWSLVLRANDKRIPDDNTQGAVALDAERVRAWCSPVKIPYPGVSLDDAACLFGVNRTTVARWANPIDSQRTWWQEVQRQIREQGDLWYPPSTYLVQGTHLMLEHFVNQANIKRSTTLVWTPGIYGLDGGGEVWSADWGELRVGLAERVPGDFLQQLQRVDRRLDGAGCSASPARRVRSRVFQWVCPEDDGGCGRLVYKLYLPMPTWTLMQALGGVTTPIDLHGLAFRCLRCAGLLYESAERTSSPGRRRRGGRRRVDVWDRFIKRISGGVLRGGEVDRRAGC